MTPQQWLEQLLLKLTRDEDTQGQQGLLAVQACQWDMATLPRGTQLTSVS